MSPASSGSHLPCIGRVHTTYLLLQIHKCCILFIQVTAYAHKDENNRFLVKRWNSEGRTELDLIAPSRLNETMEIELVRHGDLIRMEHITTRRNVHTHSEKAPLSKKQFQVTGYGEVGFCQCI